MINYAREFSGSAGTEGWVIGAALGVELFQGLRGEVEVAFRGFDFDDNALVNRVAYTHTRTRIDRVYHYAYPVSTDAYKNTLTDTVRSGPVSTLIAAHYDSKFTGKSLVADVDGSLSAFSIMANVWYDFPLGNTGIVPFVGVGIGTANLTLDYVITARTPSTFIRNRNADANIASLYTDQAPKITGTVPNPTTITRTWGTHLKNDQAVLAYQFGAGIGYEFDNGVRLTGQYRYFATGDADFGQATMGVETSDVLFGLIIPLGRDR